MKIELIKPEELIYASELEIQRYSRLIKSIKRYADSDYGFYCSARSITVFDKATYTNVRHFFIPDEIQRSGIMRYRTYCVKIKSSNNECCGYNIGCGAHYKLLLSLLIDYYTSQIEILEEQIKGFKNERKWIKK